MQIIWLDTSWMSSAYIWCHHSGFIANYIVNNFMICCALIFKALLKNFSHKFSIKFHLTSWNAHSAWFSTIVMPSSVCRIYTNILCWRIVSDTNHSTSSLMPPSYHRNIQSGQVAKLLGVCRYTLLFGQYVVTEVCNFWDFSQSFHLVPPFSVPFYHLIRQKSLCWQAVVQHICFFWA